MDRVRSSRLWLQFRLPHRVHDWKSPASRAVGADRAVGQRLPCFFSWLPGRDFIVEPASARQKCSASLRFCESRRSSVSRQGIEGGSQPSSWFDPKRGDGREHSTDRARFPAETGGHDPKQDHVSILAFRPRRFSPACICGPFWYGSTRGSTNASQSVSEVNREKCIV